MPQGLRSCCVITMIARITSPTGTSLGFEVFEWFNKNDLEFINSIPSTDCSIGIPNNIFIKSKKNTFTERIFQQLRMNFNNLGNEGGLFIVVGKKR